MLVGNMALPLMSETVWFDKPKFDEAECLYEEGRAKQMSGTGDFSGQSAATTGSIADEIAKTRQRIQNSLKNASLKVDSDEAASINSRVQKLESDFNDIKAQVKELTNFMSTAISKIQGVEQLLKSKGPSASAPPAKSEPAPEPAKADDDDIDLFGSDDEEDAAAANLREQRLKAYETKKAKKGPLVAKSSVVLDVKPWDDETDLKQMETKVREIQTDGLVWGASKSVPLAFGIHKLQIVAIVEDEKVSIDWLQETIQEIDDLVQSVDVAAFNKL